MTVWLVETLFPQIWRRLSILPKKKFNLDHWQYFPSRSMATLRNKRKLAAVSRETPEGSRSSRGQNVLDPELTQDNISQVSEEIEGRVTKKLSKEFSKTESCISGALSKLDEFLLNAQVRTCSIAVQGTSRNADSENRETHEDHSSNDPYPAVGYFPHHSGQLNSLEAETNSHMVTENYPHTNTIQGPSWTNMSRARRRSDLNDHSRLGNVRIVFNHHLSKLLLSLPSGSLITSRAWKPVVQLKMGTSSEGNYLKQ